MNRYLSKDGRVLFVADGISSGEWWGTFYQKSNGSLARFKSSKLPMRRRKRDAEQDLDQYAEANELITVSEEQKEVCSYV